jgi:hypothetical protein
LGLFAKAITAIFGEKAHKEMNVDLFAVGFPPALLGTDAREDGARIVKDGSAKISRRYFLSKSK